MKPLVFSDLDDTLFQTARKMAEAPQGDHLASIATNGSHSYMSRAQAAQFSWLAETTRLIPVTARSTEALSRCQLPFTDFRVASNGAVILDPHGAPDPDWMARLQAISCSEGRRLREIEDYASGMNEHGAYRHWVVTEYGLPVYFCIKSNGPETQLDDIEIQIDALFGSGLFKHRNGNNLAYMPHVISKLSAVEYLISKLGQPGSPIWGMGDSRSDLPFMRACQMMVVPTGSQIDQDTLKGARDA